MKIYLDGGIVLHFVNARDYAIEGGKFLVRGLRNKFVGEVTRSKMIAWHWDNEEVNCDSAYPEASR